MRWQKASNTCRRGYEFAKHIHKSKISLDFFLLQLICNLQVVQPLYSFYESIVKCPPPSPINQQETTHFLENGTLLVFGFYWPKFHVELFRFWSSQIRFLSNSRHHTSCSFIYLVLTFKCTLENWGSNDFVKIMASLTLHHLDKLFVATFIALLRRKEEKRELKTHHQKSVQQS